jgi:glutamate dehydrogenase/leucine dehydrogenase
MNEDGYGYCKDFFLRSPMLVVEWHDSESNAEGWLVMNSLRGGAAGGGTRMRVGGTREEAVFLAKTMEIKFNVAGPRIGGAKTVINFNPDDGAKEDVLRRWFKAIGPYLKHHYGTGGDMNVDEEKEAKPLIRETLGLGHPQAGIVNGHFRPADDEAGRRIIGQLVRGVGMPVSGGGMPKGLVMADVVTGFGIERSLFHYYDIIGESLEGKRVIIEGFGAVGGPAAYYLARSGARVVGIITKLAGRDMFQWARDDSGLDAVDLLVRREEMRYLPVKEWPWLDRYPEDFWQTGADVFIPAAASHTISKERILNLSAAGITVVACGANNPFGDNLFQSLEGLGYAGTVEANIDIQRLADRKFAIIPDFIANSGMARVFAYLMKDGASVDGPSILSDVEKSIARAMERLSHGHTMETGLLERAYSLFVPRPSASHATAM